MRKFCLFIILFGLILNTVSYADSWSKIGNDWYYVDNFGKSKTGLQQIDGRIYYFDLDGKMQVGWQLLNGSYYYFYQDFNTYDGNFGYMATDTLVDGFYIGMNGIAELPHDGRVPEYYSNEEKQNAQLLIDQLVNNFDSFTNRYKLIQDIKYSIYTKNQLYKILQTISQDFDAIQLSVAQLYSNKYFMNVIYNEPLSTDFGYFSTKGEVVTYISNAIAEAQKYYRDIMPIVDAMLE